jgi:replicative superfamily II helicase
MYKITNHHKLPKKKDVNVEFFFNDYKIENEFFEQDIFMDLNEAKKITKGKNEAQVTNHKEIVCVRHSQKLSAYYRLPSVFIQAKDLKKCQTIARNYLKENIYHKIPRKCETRVIKIFDELKLRNIDYKKYKELIINFVIDLENKWDCHYDNNVCMFVLENLEEKDESPTEMLSLYKEAYVNKDAIKKIKKTDKEKAVKATKKHIAEIQKEIELQKQEKDKKEQKEREEFNKNKDSLLRTAKEQLFQDRNEILRHFSNKSKEAIYSKFRTTLLLKLKKISNSKKVINKHIDNFLIINPEQIDFLNKNELQINGLNINFQIINRSYDDLISDTNKAIERKVEEAIFEHKHHTTKTVFNKIKEISIFFNVFLDKERYSLEDLLEIESFLEKSNLLKLTKRLVWEESAIKSQQYIDTVLSIHNKEDDGKKKIKEVTLKITDGENYKSIIEKAIENYIVIHTIKPNKDAYVKSYKTSQSSILKVYKDLFPEARKRGREILYYAGKTNSGKTYQAFEELKKNENGIYLAPLRLLAIEGQEEIEKRGLACSLMTGEERDLKKDARFMSSTIEMLNPSKEYDVAIIDEIQMINNRDRGDAWLQAFIGVNAKKVIVVGSNEIKAVVYRMADYLNEPVTYQEFERKSPLRMGKVASRHKKLPPHSAIISFSKRGLFDLKEKYESLGNKVSIIYGKLPPEVKIKESEKFRSGESEVLVSTDAVGMGLNLPIKNLYFHEIEKFDGVSVDYLESTLVKQIAGRAGRFGKFEEGIVSSFSHHHNNFLKKCLGSDTAMNSNCFSAKINEAIFKELSRINEKRDVIDIVDLANFVSFDITKIKNQLSYRRVAIEVNKHSKELTDSEIVRLLNAPINNHKKDIYFKAFVAMFNNLMRSRSKKIKNSDFKDLYNRIVNKGFETSEEKYVLLDLFQFYSFNFTEYKELEELIKEEKRKVSQDVIFNISNNINEDDLRYYSGY